LLRLSLGRGALPTPEDLRLEPVTNGCIQQRYNAWK
jgi:hypothetical protein